MDLQGKVIFLSDRETVKYQIDDDLLGLGILTDEKEKEIIDLLNKYGIQSQHNNYILWAVGFLSMLIPETKENTEHERISKEYIRTVKFLQSLQGVDDISKIQINIERDLGGGKIWKDKLILKENSKLYTTSGFNNVWDAIKELAESCSKQHDRKPIGRPKGSSSPGRERVLRNLAENLIQVIGMNKDDARELVYKIGLLIRLWENSGEKRKKTYKYFKDL